MAKATRFYLKQLKSGQYKRRVHDGKTGRILRWEGVEELVPEEGMYKMVEWVRYYEYRGDALHELRNFEFKLQLPDGYDIDEVEKIMDNVMDDIIYNTDTGEATHQFFNRSMEKLGADVVEYTDDKEVKWKVADKARQYRYKYPREKEWGDYIEEE